MPITQPWLARSRRMLRFGVPLALTLALVACPKVPERTSFMQQAHNVTASAAEIRERSAELGRHAAAVVELGADSIRALSDDPDVRANALRFKAQIIPEIREASLKSDPLIAVLELMGLFYQLEDYFTTGVGRTQFGPHQQIAVDVTRHLIDDALGVGMIITSGNDSAVARTTLAIKEWAAKNPIANSQYVRETPLGELESVAAAAGSLGAVAANMENEVRLLQARIAFMSDYAVREIAWRTTLGVEDAVGEETIDSLRALVIHSAALMGEFPELVSTERAAVVEALAAERIAVFQEILEHRRTVLAAVGTERAAVVAAIASERGAVLEALADERAAALASADSIVQHGLDETRSILDHVLLVAVMAGAAGIMLAGAAAFVVVRFGRPAA